MSVFYNPHAGGEAMISACVSFEPCAPRVLDDSMGPEVPSGAMVVVDPGEPVEDGRLVVPEGEGEVVLRRLRFGPAGGSDSAARCVARAGPEILLEGEWRRALRGMVTAVRTPRRRLQGPDMELAP